MLNQVFLPYSSEETEARGGECVNTIEESEAHTSHFVQRENAEEEAEEQRNDTSQIVDTVHVPVDDAYPHSFLRRPFDAFRDAM